MPGGLDGGALGFLCFGWATEAVAVAAARGTTYFFGGMAAGWEASGREIGGRKEKMGGKWGKAGRNGGKRHSTHRQGGPTRPFRLRRRPQAPPRAPGSAWVCRHQFRPEPAKNGLLGARLGRFFGAGATKTSGEGLLVARLEMLLHAHA